MCSHQVFNGSQLYSASSHMFPKLLLTAPHFKILPFNLLRLDQREKLHNKLIFFGGVHSVSGFCFGDGQSKRSGTIVKKKKDFGHTPTTNQYDKQIGNPSSLAK